MAELSHGRIPMTLEEETAVDELLVDHEIVGLTRNEPMNTGAVRVEREDGHVFLVEADGTIAELPVEAGS